MKKKTARQIQIAGRLLFLAYLVVMVYVLFFAEQYGRTVHAESAYNLTPFKEIQRFRENVGVLGWRWVLLNLAGNIIAFCPFGAILPVLHRNMRSLWKMTVLTALFSACIEGTQFITRLGVCDVDDVLLNTLGGIIGYLIFAICDQIRKRIYG